MPRAWKGNTVSTAFACLAFFSLVISPLLTSAALAQSAATGDASDTIYSEFESVVRLRSEGQYAQAIEILSRIIQEYTQSEEVVRLAYNHLVFTYLEKDDDAGARERAVEALERFPDLSANVLQFPSRVNDMYDTLRREMFGALTIQKPEGCRMFLNGDFIGETPIDLPLVRTGEYEMTLTKSGYVDLVQTVRIDAQRTVDLTGLSLDRKRGPRWWIYRAGAGVVAVALLAIGLSGGDEEPAPAVDPLPGPPDPPTQP